MHKSERDQSATQSPPVIDLSIAPGERSSWSRPKAVVYLWSVAELLFVTNPWQISSRLRVSVLRLFGARIGAHVIFRPRTRVRFPWNLEIGDQAWIGEGVWIHNQENVFIGSDVVISQETMITTGSHAHRRDMALITSPIYIHEGAWITSRCMVLGGSVVGRSALIQPMTVVRGSVAPNAIVGQGPPTVIGQRFTAADRKKSDVE